MTQRVCGASAEVVDLMDSVDESTPVEAEPHRASLEASSIEALAQGAQGLFRLLENLFPEEVDPKHQRIRLGNRSLRERVLDPLPGALDALCFLGYALREEAGEKLLCLDLARHRPETAKREAQWLRQLVHQRWSPPSWSCPTCTLHNTSGSTTCAACDGPRPLWAAPPSLPCPQLGVAHPAPKPHAKTQVTTREEHRSRVTGIQRASDEKARERERILAEARADRQRFDVPGGSGRLPGASSLPNATSQGMGMAAEEAPSAKPSFAALRIRLPDGVVVEKAFDGSQLLQLVFEHVDCFLRARDEQLEDYALVQAIPRRVFLREVLGGRSLAELALVPSAMLSVLRAEDRGRVQSGGVEMALLTGNIEGLSYEEMLELESRMGECKRVRRMSKRTRDAQTKVHAFGADENASSASSSLCGREKSCAICLNDFEAGASLRTLWCGHAFHVACVDRWLTEKDECPICRVAFTA